MPLALIKSGVILKFVEGESLHTQQNGKGRYDFGTLIYQMHKLTQISCNEWGTGQKLNFDYLQKSLSEWSGNDLEEIDNWSRSMTILFLLATQARLYCEITKPVFNHNDLHDGQTIVSGRRLTLIDFEEWIGDRPLNDLAVYLFHSIRTGQSPNRFEIF